ncbi:MAG: 16S rRNA (cytosine(1402)-N(4))-methyltransferase RsmH [Vampirovibrionales bacterium]|nr:16S rRNA (cytosine(1402)-N(4))-methyltransferase RsmH [Vampirovibrionales bacterium]
MRNTSNTELNSHISVLRDETLAALAPSGDRHYVDATLGAGGHTRALLALYPYSRLTGFDRDPKAIALTESTLNGAGIAPERYTLINAPYSEITRHLAPQSITGGLMADLGFASFQVNDAERGWSFSQNAPLDMRYNPQDASTPTAAMLLATLEESELRHIFSTYGEDPLARPIARAIVADRETAPLTHTLALAELVARIARTHYKAKSRTHPATRVFQALRIAVNQEFEHLNKLLEALPALCAPGARIAVITFHSLEDRIVKQQFKQWLNPCRCPAGFPKCVCGETLQWETPHRKAITPTEAEVRHNPRARSAKLRVIIKR